MQNNYSSQVGSPIIAKQQQRAFKEAKDYEEVRLRYDKEKEFIERQKQQAKELNSH